MNYVEKNKLTLNAGSRPMLYHLYHFFNNLAGNWPGPSACPVELVDSDPAGGAWTAEGAVGDGAFIVIGSTMVWPGTTKKWQAVIAATSTGIAIGGLGAPSGAGMHVMLSPDGGWASGPQDFSGLTSPPDIPASTFKSIKGNNTGTDLSTAIMNIAVCERIPSGGSVDQCCVIMYGDNGADGTYDIGCYLGAIFCFEDTATNPHPSYMATGKPQCSTGLNYYWGSYVAGHNGQGPNAADNGWTKLSIDPDAEPNWTGSKLLTQRNSKIAGFPILIHDFTANKVVGWPVEVYRVDSDISDGTPSDDGNRICMGGLSLPYVTT